jgi:hypothetical protein
MPELGILQTAAVHTDAVEAESGDGKRFNLLAPESSTDANAWLRLRSHCRGAMQPGGTTRAGWRPSPLLCPGRAPDVRSTFEQLDPPRIDDGAARPLCDHDSASPAPRGHGVVRRSRAFPLGSVSFVSCVRPMQDSNLLSLQSPRWRL